MKKVILFVFSLCFTLLLNAQVSKTANATTGHLTSKIDTTQRTAPIYKNNQGMDANKHLLYDLNRPDMYVLRSGQNFEFNRIELEKQTVAEMENYRNELFDRLIKEEYYRLINDQTPDIQNNTIDRTTKLAKYKTLRDLLQEQSRRSKPILANTGQTNAPPNNPQELDNIRQQLDLKIGEEEQRAEMFTRHRMEMERRMEQERQQQQNK